MASGAASVTTFLSATPSATSVSTSTTTTSSPLSLRWAASHWPTKPLPPVISARMLETLVRAGQGHPVRLDVPGGAGLPCPFSGHRQTAGPAPLDRGAFPTLLKRRRQGP